MWIEAYQKPACAPEYRHLMFSISYDSLQAVAVWAKQNHLSLLSHGHGHATSTVSNEFKTISSAPPLISSKSSTPYILKNSLTVFQIDHTAE